MSNPTLISLVDDHSLLRNGLASLINSFEEYKVLSEADNGRDFIKSIDRNNPPAIILLDITMPLMNGYETAEWIRDNLPDAKVLVLSMMDNDMAVIRMMKYGCRGYILKDCKPYVLKEALDQIRDYGYYINDLVSNRMVKYLHEDKPKNAPPFSVSFSDREMTFLKW